MLPNVKDAFCPGNRPCDYQQFVRTVRKVIREDILMNFYSSLNFSFVKEILVVTFVIWMVLSRVVTAFVDDTGKGKVFPLQARLWPRGWVEV